MVEESDERFYIAQSTIPKAGLGCFARVPLLKHDYLEVLGVMVKAGSVCDQATHYANAHKFAAEPPQEYQHRIVPMGYASFVNHANTTEQQNVVLACMEKDYEPRSMHSGRIIYGFLRDIAPGEELLTNYNRLGDHAVRENKLMNADEVEEWRKFIDRNLYNLHDILFPS